MNLHLPCVYMGANEPTPKSIRCLLIDDLGNCTRLGWLLNLTHTLNPGSLTTEWSTSKRKHSLFLLHPLSFFLVLFLYIYSFFRVPFQPHPHTLLQSTCSHGVVATAVHLWSLASLDNNFHNDNIVSSNFYAPQETRVNRVGQPLSQEHFYGSKWAGGGAGTVNWRGEGGSLIFKKYALWLLCTQDLAVRPLRIQTSHVLPHLRCLPQFRTLLSGLFVLLLDVSTL